LKFIARDLNVSLPEFVLCNTEQAIIPSTSSTVSLTSNPHLNYYYLNNKGKDAIKRILCVFEYLFPQVTYSPGLVSLSSLLLHYMQEHEVFSALCYLSSTKEHLIETKTNWDVTCSVFMKLIKIYCVSKHYPPTPPPNPMSYIINFSFIYFKKSSYDIISKYATDPLDKIFNEWFWWIFDSLSFNYLIRIMDCYLIEGRKVLFRVSLAIVQQFSKCKLFIHI